MQDYMRAAGSAGPSKVEQAQSETKKEIEQLMAALDEQLTALSNFHYTPRQAQEEITVVTNVSAVKMEDGRKGERGSEGYSNAPVHLLATC
jgi:U3 small nucleolar RNA-associated protein MPP10